MFYVLKKTFRFEAAHYLPEHDGKCKNLHGHSWVATISVSGRTINSKGAKTGMLLDYTDISKIAKPLIESLDHKCLNDLFTFTPTSELLAQWIYNQLSEDIPEMYAVTINETCTSECTYQREEILL